MEHWLQAERELTASSRRVELSSQGTSPSMLWAHFQGGDVAKAFAELEKSANVMIDDLLWWTAALKAARER